MICRSHGGFSASGKEENSALKDNFLCVVTCSVQASFYVLFLTLLSYALIYGSTVEDPTQYSGKADGLRLFCEIITIIFLMFYFFEEVNEAER